jgi:diguanylate cyclase (GGDEF)-like protein
MSQVGTQFTLAKLKGFLSVRARLALMALILVVPFMADRVRVLESSRATQAHTISVSLLNAARRSADAQRQMMSSIETLLRSVAYSASASGSSAGCGMIRSSLDVELPWITSLVVAGADGKIRCATLPNYEGLNLSDRPYFQGALQKHQFVLSNYVLSKFSGQPALLAAYAAPATAGEPEYVVVAGVSLKWMMQLMNGLRERPGVIASIVDSNGVVLASQSDDPDFVGRRLKDQSLLNLVASQQAGSTSITAADGTARAISFTRIPETGLALLISVDETKMLSAIDHDIRKAYLQLALVAIFVLLGAWWASERLIIRPIRALTMMATRLGEGDLSTRTDRSGMPPEFAQLTTALNIMAGQLGERERELRASNSHLTVIASVDPVSRLANRRGFDSRLAFEWMRAEHNNHSLALMMVDIDHFKLFNDTYGHPEGDACLGRVGEALSVIANEVTGFAARYGGEEFCLMVAGIGGDRATEIAEMVRRTVERLNLAHVAAPLGHLTVSIGIALARPAQGDTDAKALVEAADAGLYAAKRRGRNTVVEHGAIRVTDQPWAAAEKAHA